MKVIKISPSDKNFTPIVVKALCEAECDTVLEFEKGKYNFYEFGCLDGLFAPTNNETGNKHVVFPM